MISIKSLKKFVLLGSLYLSQFMPFWFLYQALPVFMRQKGLSLEAISLLPLLSLPITLKFLWSPLIDRYGFTRWGHYRFWIICFQILIASITAVSAWLDVEHNFNALLVCMTIICLFSASQDIATDALAVSLLEPHERGLGNAVQSAGGSLGAAIGGGGMLILLNYWGWTASLQILAVIMFVALIPLFWHREEVKNKQIALDNAINERYTNLTDRVSAVSSSVTKPTITLSTNFLLPISYFKIFINFCRSPGMRNWLLVLLLYSASSSMAGTMFRPLLVDIGLSLADIGWLMGIVNTVAAILGGIIAGFLIAPWGRKRSLTIFSLLWAMSMAAYLIPAFGVTSLFILYFVVVSTEFAGGMIGTTTFTIMMDKARSESPGTDYTIQTSVGIFGSIVGAAISGFLAQATGYWGVFAISLALAIISVLMISKFVRIQV
ncbi:MULTISPECIES: MFS transporter [unclassified Nostoc]|uniref:MFS transporter n=1 Tax=unclassified Nostoc TaxID=2593658 RepID=UPI002AD43F5F|nr:MULTISPECIES: MFS transporter [unclassified Nostoc]MDZ8121567.1 MFS transporter [Nostoc sp. CmiVER01]MDZ8227263.1 MFS transporter [Nostoc sp. ChiVER01]